MVVQAEEAIVLLTGALEHLPPDADVQAGVELRLNRAAGYTMLGREEAAARDRVVAADRAPRQSEIILQRALALHEAGDADRAIAMLSEQVADDPDIRLALVLARMRARRDSGEDRADALTALSALLLRLDDETMLVRVEVIETLVEIHAAGAAFVAARALLTDVAPQMIGDIALLTFQADVERHAGERTTAEALFQRALAALTPAATPGDVRRLAILTGQLGHQDDALPLWRRLVPDDRVTPDTTRLLDCARECGADETILLFCRALRDHDVIDPECFDTELALLEHYNALPEAIRLIEAYLRAPTDQRLAAHLRIRLGLIAVRTGSDDLITTLVPALPPVDSVNAWQGRGVVEVLRHGPHPADALDYAYRAYDALIMASNIVEGTAIAAPTPMCVAADTAVHVREDDTGTERWWILESETGARREYEEIAPRDAMWQALLGKRVGEQVPLPGTPFHPRTGTIAEILPKVFYRWRWCMAEVPIRFPAQASAQMIPLQSGPDGELDPAPILQMAEERAADLRRIETLYTGGHLPLHVFGVHYGRSALEAIVHLAAAPSLPVYCCPTGGREEMLAALAAMRSATALVIDLSALGSLLVLDEVDLLRAVPVPVIVPPSVLALVRERVRATQRRAHPTGYLSAEEAGPVFTEDTPEAVASRRARWAHLLATIEEVGQVDEQLALAALSRSQRERLVTAMGQAGAEAAALAVAPGHVLWTDDHIGALLAGHDLRVRSGWTAILLLWLRETGAIAAPRASRASVRLAAAGYTGTSLMTADIVLVLEDAAWHADSGVARGTLDWLARAPLTRDGLAQLAMQLLAALWRRVPLVERAEVLTIRVLERVAARLDGAAIVDAIERGIDVAFGIDAFNAVRARNIIRAWRTTGGRTTLALPPGTTGVPITPRRSHTAREDPTSDVTSTEIDHDQAD